MTLTLMYREYCGLCRQMRDDLQPYLCRYGLTLEILDVDSRPDWEARYDELVPVLLCGETEICHWHLDEAALLAFLESRTA